MSTKSSTCKLIEIGIAEGSISDAGISDEESRSLVRKHSSPLEMAWGLIRLHDSDLLNSENKKALEKHSIPNGIALVLRLLHSVKLLTPENRLAIQKENDPHSVAYVLFKLYEADLFTQENFDKVLSHSKLDSKIDLLCGFDKKNRLTQALFEQLIVIPEKNSLSNGHTESNKLSISTPNLAIHNNDGSSSFYLSNGHTEVNKLSISTKSTPNLAIHYNCGSSNFFLNKKQRHHLIQTSTEYHHNHQICKK